MLQVEYLKNIGAEKHRGAEVLCLVDVDIAFCLLAVRLNCHSMSNLAKPLTYCMLQGGLLNDLGVDGHHAKGRGRTRG